MEATAQFELIPSGLMYGLSITEKAAVLRRNSWLNNLDIEQLEKLGNYLSFVHLEKGKSVFHQGDEIPFMAIVHAGKIEIRKVGHDGEEQIIAVIGPGHVIGEMSLIDGGARSATAIAVENTQLFVLTKDNFDAIRKEHTGLWGGLLMRSVKTVTKRLRRASGQFVDLLSEHGALNEDDWQHQAQRQQQASQDTEAQFLIKQLGALQYHFDRLSDHIQDRANAFQQQPDEEIKIDLDIYEALERRAIYHKQSMAQHVNQILRQYIQSQQ
ncbi:MAG: cyclic nucleotide-binding domain-containing protein [Pseudomonadales bacterium]|nr:cyclic nucleotide-binding domain-containing protein [Pseudomonadales bacterium]